MSESGVLTAPLTWLTICHGVLLKVTVLVLVLLAGAFTVLCVPEAWLRPSVCGDSLEIPVTDVEGEVKLENGGVPLATALTQIATLCLVIVAVVQLVLLRRTINESARARSASVMLGIYDIMNELRASWLELYGYSDDFRNWDSGQRLLADRVGVGLQQVAYLCLEGLVDKRYVVGNWAGTFVKSWRKLEGYIRDYRVQSGEPSEIEKGGFQRKHFELLARECQRLYVY